jgi:anti-anti-sigma regulatory factor
METLTLPPVLDGPTLERFRSRLLGTIRCAEDSVVTLDASEVECITSAGLDLLVVATLLADDRGLRLRIGAASELFRRSIALTGLAGHLSMAAEPALI